MKKLILFTIAFLLIKVSFAQNKLDRQQILDVLALQESSWNSGDIISFMEGYWKSDSLQFIGKDGVIKGWVSTRDRYLKSYSNRDKMGTLKFEIQNLDLHGSEYAWILGKWHLNRPKEGDIGGYFTLVFRKINGKWLIISDHTS
jgi:ketosteroid isomerase-like protein